VTIIVAIPDNAATASFMGMLWLSPCGSELDETAVLIGSLNHTLGSTVGEPQTVRIITTKNAALLKTKKTNSAAEERRQEKVNGKT
jgi:hypothetical protein